MRKSAPLFCALLLSLSARRAWIEISKAQDKLIDGLSLSARRAWIEIRVEIFAENTTRPSLSARRAWIEIGKIKFFHRRLNVALRKESVDRNNTYPSIHRDYCGRSPQGERG